MSRIRAKDTKPEILVRKFLHSKGLRFRLHDKKLPGKPDLVFPSRKKVVFVHGCFWHGHQGCKYFVVPKTKQEWWLNKFDKNRQRDESSIDQLKSAGWDVTVIWECELKLDRLRNLEKVLKQFDIH